MADLRRPLDFWQANPEASASTCEALRQPRPMCAVGSFSGGFLLVGRCHGHQKVANLAQLEQFFHGIDKRFCLRPVRIGTKLLRFGWCCRRRQVWRSAIENGPGLGLDPFLDSLLPPQPLLIFLIFGVHRRPLDLVDDRFGILVGFWLTLLKSGYYFLVPR